jgi:carbamoyltransferase
LTEVAEKGENAQFHGQKRGHEPVKILGISAFYHDSAAALLDGGEIVAAAQEERFTRKKHDPAFPANAIRFCLESTGTAFEELEAVAFYDKPFLKFERLLETYYAFAPRGVRSFLAAMPVWIKEKLLLKRLLLQELSRLAGHPVAEVKLLFPEHHLSHAASAFYPSPFEEAAILTVDGVGEWATASICHGKGAGISILRELRFPHSIGLLYSAFTYYLGFRVNSGEYKLMGLAPYGDPEADRTRRYEEAIRREMIDVAADGSLWLNQDYFDYATGLRMAVEPAWERLFGFPRREAEAEMRQEHCDLALAIQRVTEEVVLAMAREAQRLTGSRNLCLAGGVALNCVANGKLLRSGIFDGLWIQPAAGDAGGALGAALCAHYIGRGHERAADGDRMHGSYLGPEPTTDEVRRVVLRHKAVGRRYDDFGELCAKTAEILDGGNVVGWMHGRMEWGPRALGNRSIIADPRNPEIQRKLNLKIKYRESFRPFAPSVLAEECGSYFALDGPSPYMLLIADVLPARRNPLPAGYHALPLRDKLYFLRSDIPAVTHLDYSARIQTVHRETNPDYWRLIDAFRARTGYGVIVNTSFNVRGEPIVCTPEDAYRCFMRTEMDYLVVENWIFDKREQPAWKEAKDWKQTLIMD